MSIVNFDANPSEPWSLPMIDGSRVGEGSLVTLMPPGAMIVKFIEGRGWVVVKGF